MPRYLKPLKQTRFPRNVLALDTETYFEDRASVQHHTFRCAVGCQLRWASSTDTASRCLIKPQRFTDKDTVWDWIHDQQVSGRSLYVFAHNLGFDLRILDFDTAVRERGWQIVNLVDSQPPTYVTLKTDRGHIRLLDSYNHFPVPLAKIADLLGCRKDDLPDQHESIETWLDHCQWDAVILSRLIVQWRDAILRNELGSLRATIGAQAMASFQRILPRHTLLIHEIEHAKNLERGAYRGARAEPMYLGTVHDTLYRLDVNSCYPHLMSTHEYPVKLLGFQQNVSLPELRRLTDHHNVIATVDVATDRPVFPADHNGHTVYPVGTFTTTLTTRELDYALDNQLILGVQDVAFYKPRALFEDWGNKLICMRRLGEDLGNGIAVLYSKLLANSLYGKFAQHRRHWETVTDVIPPDDADLFLWQDPDTMEVYDCRVRVNVVQRLAKGGETAHSAPAIAAHVTADARMQLWRLMLKAGYGNVYYVDTDSLIVNKAGYHALADLIGELPGQLKLEAIADDVVIHGRKDYSMNGELVKSGIPRNREQIGPNTWKYDEFEPWRADMSQPTNQVTVTRRLASRTVADPVSGIQLPSGRLHPFLVSRDPLWPEWLVDLRESNEWVARWVSDMADLDALDIERRKSSEMLASS